MASDRKELIDAAAGAIARDPAMSMQEIAEAIGVSRTTLHRAFSTREALGEAVTEWALEECARHFDAAGIDDAPVLEAFDRIAAAVVPVAMAHTFLFSEHQVYRVPRLAKAIEAQDERFERYFARGQAEGTFDPDLPPRWLVFSVGAQFVAIWWAIQDGFVASREAPRLLRATVLGGLAEGER